MHTLLLLKELGQNQKGRKPKECAWTMTPRVKKHGRDVDGLLHENRSSEMKDYINIADLALSCRDARADEALFLAGYLESEDWAAAFEKWYFSPVGGLNADDHFRSTQDLRATLLQVTKGNSANRILRQDMTRRTRNMMNLFLECAGGSQIENTGITHDLPTELVGWKEEVIYNLKKQNGWNRRPKIKITDQELLKKNARLKERF